MMLAKQSRPKKIMVLVGIVAVLIVLIGTLAIIFSNNTPGDTVPVVISEDLQRATTITLYYPKKLPAGYHVVDGSAKLIETNVVTFVIASAGGQQIVVTEQPKPQVMEEVQKDVQFVTPIGKAYIANLNGRSAGFIVAPGTLIIVSSAGWADANALRGCMLDLAIL